MGGPYFDWTGHTSVMDYFVYDSGFGIQDTGLFFLLSDYLFRLIQLSTTGHWTLQA